MILRFEPSMTSSYWAVGHETLPVTETFRVASQVPAASSIQGPTANAPPPFGLPPSHTNNSPTAGVVVVTCAVPIGSFVRSTGWPAQVLTIPSAMSVVVVVLGIVVVVVVVVVESLPTFVDAPQPAARVKNPMATTSAIREVGAT